MKPRVRMVQKDGDADKVVVSFFTRDGRPAKDQLVMLGNCESIVSRGTWQQSMYYKINRAIWDFDREVLMGFWA